MKPIRRAAKCLIIENGKIVITKYLQGRKVGYYDIPGGKIEDGETAEEAAIREVKEETGLEVSELVKKGIFEVDYPERKFYFEVFIARKYIGTPENFDENTSEWIEINELLNKENILSNLLMLEPQFNKALYDEKYSGWGYEKIYMDNPPGPSNSMQPDKSQQQQAQNDQMMQLLQTMAGARAPQPTYQAQPSATPTKFCTECGKRIPADSKHCPECGAKQL